MVASRAGARKPSDLAVSSQTFGLQARLLVIETNGGLYSRDLHLPAKPVRSAKPETSLVMPPGTSLANQDSKTPDWSLVYSFPSSLLSGLPSRPVFSTSSRATVFFDAPGHSE